MHTGGKPFFRMPDPEFTNNFDVHSVKSLELNVTGQSMPIKNPALLISSIIHTRQCNLCEEPRVFQVYQQKISNGESDFFHRGNGSSND